MSMKISLQHVLHFALADPADFRSAGSAFSQTTYILKSTCCFIYAALLAVFA